MTTTTEIINGDCVAVLSTLAQRPRLIFADPPYNQRIDYGDGKAADRRSTATYREWTGQWIAKCARALTDDGSLWVMTSQEHQAAAFDSPQ